jgi:uncharacterized protein (TIGR03083 family)
VVEITLEDLQGGLRLASTSVTTFLRSEPDVMALTPGGEWTVRDTAVHLICATRMFTGVFRGQPSRFDTAMDETTFNAAVFLAMDENRPGVLADLTEVAVTSLLDASTRRRRDDPCQYRGLPLTVGLISAGACNEYLLHAYDMARAAGREWSCPESAADLSWAVVSPLWGAYNFNPEAAGHLEGSFAIESPNGRVCFQMRPGSMELLKPDAETDCTIVGPSSQLLVWLSGRAGWEGVNLLASGPRPDLAPFLASSLIPL